MWITNQIVFSDVANDITRNLEPFYLYFWYSYWKHFLLFCKCNISVIPSNVKFRTLSFIYFTDILFDVTCGTIPCRYWTRIIFIWIIVLRMLQLFSFNRRWLEASNFNSFQSWLNVRKQKARKAYIFFVFLLTYILLLSLHMHKYKESIMNWISYVYISEMVKQSYLQISR